MIYAYLPTYGFMARPSQIDSSDEEIIALGRKEVPYERACEIEIRMRWLAEAFAIVAPPTERRH